MNFARDAIIMCRISSVKQNIGNSLSEQEAMRCINFAYLQVKDVLMMIIQLKILLN